MGYRTHLVDSMRTSGAVRDATCLGLVLLAVVLLEGCSIEYVRYSHPETYEVSQVVETLAINIKIIDQLDDKHAVVSRPFREQGILALDMQCTNNGNDNIVLIVSDFLLEIDSNDRERALTPKRKVSLVGNTTQDAYIYEQYGWPAEVVLKPGQTRAGLLFFPVGHKYEEAKRGQVIIQFLAGEVSKRVLQYKVALR